MSEFNFEDHPHRRLNILTGEWVLVSPHRTKRPWQGKVEKLELEKKPSYDPKCYLCPGNERAGGQINPEYSDTFVFNNDFAALLEDTPEGGYNKKNLLVAKSEKGLAKVIVFSPDHSLTLPLMEVSDIRKVVDLWVEEYLALAEKDFINYVQIFENKGEIMGCSNPHPHGQIWAQSSIPDIPAKKTANMNAYYEEHGKSILEDYLEIELKKRERIIFENEHFVALVPFWAVWPYEAMIVSKRHVKHIGHLSLEERDSYAEIIKKLTIAYDNLFETSFPYSAGIHQAPTDGNENDGWHMHMTFMPPLLRSATVKKFMVGYEMLANPQRDITAEFAAKKLRDLPEKHFSI
ncbi:UDP-glucose--hexose-1-phosphate uridylyltransferase [Aureibacter tunicatorum]|uniref:Galactose-1-phosphate uridylyltransferase n=1 Tax=Aureibacter tunicatorum TaxID=866807 RepID=A0AAE3XRH1_9BACT|nr:UDP-glucose--hexose-1-phosphate uridylyltransferase [Aureibacter tunicatorum]MDR6240556.1 UDPglucose--hexose-1-phosphate uridylyltransferase [Aureibacter tunicatorum]